MHTVQQTTNVEVDVCKHLHKNYSKFLIIIIGTYYLILVYFVIIFINFALQNVSVILAPVARTTLNVLLKTV